MNTLEESIDDLFISDEEAYEMELYRQIIREQEYDFIYKIEFYNNENKVVNNMYYYKASDTKWIFDSNQKFNVFYIKVPNTSKEYQSAYYNSKILDDLSSKKFSKKINKNSNII
jgi:hypothetical protein